MVDAATVRLNFLRRPQSFRSAPFPSLCSVHASSSPQGDGGTEIRRSRRRFKIPSGNTIASRGS